MPTFYNFRQNGVDYSFDDVFVPADLFRSGNLFTWAWGNDSQLGNASSIEVSTPVTTFAGGSNWKQVSCASFNVTAAIKTDGTLWVWGRNNAGQLGVNDTIRRSTPVTTFAGGTDWKQVSCGTDHTAAIKTDGTLWTWGKSSRNVFEGREFNQNVITPITTSVGGTNWKQVSCGYWYTAAVKTDGSLWSWGYSYFGQLGRPDDYRYKGTPVTTFAGGTNWADTASRETENLYTISAGAKSTAAIKTDGTLWTWGYGAADELGNANLTDRSTPVTTFAGGTNWKQVSSGGYRTAAIKTDGTLWIWGQSFQSRLGNNSPIVDISTPITTFAGGTNWKQISCGNLHTAATKTDGTLWTWGFGGNGRLGNAQITNVSTPVTTFAGGTDWKQVSAGAECTAAIKTDGTLWTWGQGNNGRLGNNTVTNTNSTPVTTFAGGTNWKQVSSSGAHTSAIKTDGTLWTWGEGAFGQLGTNDLTTRSTPVTTFAGGTNWKQVSSGRIKTAAIKTDGTLWTWGYGASGQLGNAQITNRSTPVTTFAGGTNWKQVSAGGYHVAALQDDGINATLFVWGNGTYGKLGNATTTNTNSTPVTTFAGGTNWADTATTEPEDLYTISGGGFYSSAIKTDGTLWTWGRGSFGTLGTNDTTERSTPVTTFAGGTDWKQVSSGGDNTAAIKTDGTLWTWGGGFSGRLGNAQLTNRSTPVTTFAGGTDWKQVSSGGSHTAAIKTDGTLWTWGSGLNGILGTNDTTQRSTPVTTFAGGTDWKQVSSGSAHTAAIKTDGTLWTWGNGGSGRLGFRVENNIRSTPVTTFAGGTNWADTPTTEPEDLYTLSAGSSHTAAIKTDGTLWTWGNMSLLGSELPSILTPVTTFAGGTNWADTPTTEPEDLYTLSAGSSHTAAIKTDGTLWTWGDGTFGRLGTNVTTTRSTPVTTFAGGTDWKQVSSGGFHTAAIKTDGTLWTWGSGANGRLGNRFTTQRNSPVTTFAGGTNWKQVSSGGFHTAAVKTDGTLWTWGPGNNGRLGNAVTTGNISTPVTTFAGGTDWKQVSSGTSHTAAIKTDGTLWTWGAGGNGRLGTNDSTDISTPVTTFAGGTNWKQVSSGGFHTAAIKTDGTLWTWGAGNNGRLGTNDLTDRSTPVTTFAGGTDWKQVSIGYRHTAAVKTDGTLWTWGRGDNGRLGTNDTTDRSTPVTTFAGGTDWKQLSSGDEHIVALRDDGVNKELFVWGIGTSGQLGISNFDGNVPNVLEGTNWKQVSAGSQHTAAIKTDGTLWTWGNGSSGRLGNAVTTGNISTPVTTFAGGTDWKQVSGGNAHTAAIKTDGTLWTWGSGGAGELGTNDLTDRSTPVTTFAGGTDWKQVSSGRDHTAAIKTDGTLWTWGLGSNGRLGTNDLTNRSTPITTFAGGTNWKQISCGDFHTAATKTDGTLWTWGFGGNGRLGNAVTTGNIFTPVTTFAGGTDWKQVSSGFAHTAAIKTDGTLWTWGNGTDGRLGTNDLTDRSTPVTTFAGGTDWKQVNSGSQHIVALRDDGVNKELFVWGNGTSGQLGINTVIFNSVFTPSTTFAGGTDWKQVSSGGFHTAAIKTDGTLWTWGNGFSGRLGTNDTTERNTPVTTFAGGTNWKQVSAGNSHTAAIKTGGTLWTWGRGDYGQLGNDQFTWNFNSGISIQSLTPITTFAGGTDWKQISCGSRHTLAIRGTLGNYELFAFGDTYYGELGGAINIKSNSIPKPIFGNSFDWKQVDCGYHNTAAIKTDGTLWTWGRAQEGVLGSGGNLISNALTPITTFAGGTNWKQVSVGGYYSNFVASAVKTDGTLWIWGEDQRGILGIGGDDPETAVSTPVTTFAGGTNWKSVSAGGYTVFGIKTDGTLWGWGSQYSSQLGVGDDMLRSTPVTTFAGGTNWKQIDHSFGYSTAAVTYEDPIL